MKYYLFLFITLSLLNSVFAQNKTTEQDAIRKVIDQKSQYFYDRNYDKWASTWAHEPTSYWEYAGPDFNNGQTGWETISAGMKEEMKNPQNLSADEIAARSKKYDYQYKINGNLAHVIYRQGKGSMMTATLEKQNGAWKITGSVNINTAGYKFIKSLASLKSFLGKWKYVDGSYKTEGAQPADSNYKQLSSDYDIHETPYGVQFSSVNISSYMGKPYTSLATEDFVGDKAERVIKYYDFQKDNDNVSTVSGTASFDSTENFVVKGMYADKPTQIQFENIYSFARDGLLHQEGRGYDIHGKVTFKWFFALKRDL